MESRNTRRWLTRGGVLALAPGVALLASGSLPALIDTNALLRLLDILDLYPF